MWRRSAFSGVSRPGIHLVGTFTLPPGGEFASPLNPFPRDQVLCQWRLKVLSRLHDARARFDNAGGPALRLQLQLSEGNATNAAARLF